MPAHLKKSRKKVILLWVIIFSHILPVIISAFYDQATHAKHNVNLTELRYWLWAFTWWSAWASLLTVPWAIYKLFTLQKKRSSFSEQMWDIMVAETNFLSGIIFCCGGFYLTFHRAFKAPEIIFPLVGNVRTIYVWLIYNFFWHVLAPGLAFYYFWKYCRVDKLAKREWSNLMVNFFNPAVYLLYVMLRPKISNFTKSSPSLPRTYPPDYPYPPFFELWGSLLMAKNKKQAEVNFYLGVDDRTEY